jgi:hypothetical protein
VHYAYAFVPGSGKMCTVGKLGGVVLLECIFVRPVEKTLQRVEYAPKTTAGLSKANFQAIRDKKDLMPLTAYVCTLLGARLDKHTS